MVLAVGPNVLHRVQFRRIRRQVLYIQATFLNLNDLMRDLAFVGRKPVSKQQYVARYVVEQLLEELDHLLGPDRFLQDLKIELPALHGNS